MPAEWEPHEGTWIAWPHNREDWPGKFAPIPWVYTEIVRHLSREEMVFLVVAGRKMQRKVSDILDRAGVDLAQVRFFKCETDRAWLRDSGPTFVVRKTKKEDREAVNSGAPLPVPLGLIDWKFNAWAKYDNYLQDRYLPRRIARRFGLPRWVPRVPMNGKPVRIVLEGGAIDVNGCGSLLTTEECLLSDVQCRNPGLDRAGLERVLSDHLGVSNVIWLGRGIAGDDTHGHVDDLARFVDPHTVVTVVEPQPDDANHELLEDNLRRLQAAADQEGRPLRVATLPMPAPVLFDGQRLPASYANFYIANGLVLVPTFNDPADRIALDTLSGLFPGREVIGIHSLDLVLGLGTLHCLSQQQPALADPASTDDVVAR
jgi:agmatine deiminase